MSEQAIGDLADMIGPGGSIRIGSWVLTRWPEPDEVHPEGDCGPACASEHEERAE